MVKTGGRYSHPETPSNNSLDRTLSVIGSAFVDGINLVRELGVSSRFTLLLRLTCSLYSLLGTNLLNPWQAKLDDTQSTK